MHRDIVNAFLGLKSGKMLLKTGEINPDSGELLLKTKWNQRLET